MKVQEVKERQRERKRKRVIMPKLGENGWRPKAIKTVLHVEPTNISEVLNMDPIRPIERRRKEEIDGERKKR